MNICICASTATALLLRAKELFVRRNVIFYLFFFVVVVVDYFSFMKKLEAVLVNVIYTYDE